MADEHGRLQLAPGDLCHHGSNLLPTYEVVFVDGEKVWLRDVNTGQDAVVSTNQCHKLGVRLEELRAENGGPAPTQPKGLTWPDGTPRP